MTKFFNKLKKAYFWPILDTFFLFSGQKCFLKIDYVTQNLKWFSNTMPKLIKKLMTQFQEKVGTDGRTDPIL